VPRVLAVLVFTVSWFQTLLVTDTKLIILQTILFPFGVINDDYWARIGLFIRHKGSTKQIAKYKVQKLSQSKQSSKIDERDYMNNQIWKMYRINVNST